MVVTGETSNLSPQASHMASLPALPNLKDGVWFHGTVGFPVPFLIIYFYCLLTTNMLISSTMAIGTV